MCAVQSVPSTPTNEGQDPLPYINTEAADIEAQRVARLEQEWKDHDREVKKAKVYVVKPNLTQTH